MFKCKQCKHLLYVPITGRPLHYKVSFSPPGSEIYSVTTTGPQCSCGCRMVEYDDEDLLRERQQIRQVA